MRSHFSLSCDYDILNNINSGSVSGYSVGMGVWGSVGLVHAGKRKKSASRLRPKKSRNRAWPQLWAPEAPMQFPRAGNNVLSYRCVRLRAPRSDKSSASLRRWIRISRRCLLPLGLSMPHNRSQHAWVWPREICLRARMAHSRAGVTWQIDMGIDRKGITRELVGSWRM